MSFLAVGSRNGFSLFFAPWKEDFDWTVSQLSVVAAIGTVTNALTTPLLGNMYDRFGGKRVIIMSLVIFGMGTVALSQVNAFWQLMIIYGFVISFAASGVSFVTTGPLISRWFDRKRGTAMAIQTAGAPVGGMLIVPFSAYLLELTDWRWVWAVLALLILAIGLPLAYFVLKENPQQMGLEPDGGEAVDSAGRRQPTVARCAPPLECVRWQDAFRSAPLWQLSLAYFVCGVTTTALAIHFVPFATDQGMSPQSAATAFGLMMGLNVAGVLSAGYLSDRWGSKNLLAGVYFTRGLAYAVLIFTSGGSAIWVFVCIAGLSWIATVPLTYSLTREIYGIRAMGTLSGIVTMSHQIGGAITVWLAGWAFDRYGTYTPLWVAGAALLGVASLLAYSVRERALAARYQPPLPAQDAPAAVPAGGA
jgi:MFS family permease